MARLLITGGAGFIGSHTCVLLTEAGHDLIVIDSFVNSSPLALKGVCEIAKITSQSTDRRLKVVKGDVRNKATLEKIFTEAVKEDRKIDAVIHFAGLKSVHESLEKPLKYWDANVSGSCCLLSAMNKYNCRTLIFSSSATIYGAPDSLPITEKETITPINPYGNTKAAIEKILFDLTNMNDNWRIASLRYFNPVGAHPSGQIGESPLGTPQNLFPFISQVASGERKTLKIYGGDWPTADGTCIRDYIHIMDLAEGHLAAFEYLIQQEEEFITLNLGTGKGYSVLEVVNSFSKATGMRIDYEIVGRRDGDTAETVADPSLAKKILRWETRKSLLDMCCDSWTWQKYSSNIHKISTIIPASNIN